MPARFSAVQPGMSAPRAPFLLILLLRLSPGPWATGGYACPNQQHDDGDDEGAKRRDPGKLSIQPGVVRYH